MKKRGVGKLRNVRLLSKVASGFAILSFLLIANSTSVVRGQGMGDLQKEIQALKQRLETLETKAEQVKRVAPPQEIKKLVERVDFLEKERKRPPAVAGRADLKSMVDEMWSSYQRKKEKAKLFSISVHGLAKNWAISQNKFRFGKDQIRDNYVVSIFRILPEISTLGGDVKFVGRFDIAQGWWGVDNERGTFIDHQGDNRNSSNLFSNKGTNYAFHADWAYIDFRLPFIPNDFLTRAKFGRMWFGVGNKLVLDYDYDGIQTVTKHGAHTLTLGWAKISEGYMGLGDREGKDQNRQWDAMNSFRGFSGEDTNLWMVKDEYVLPEKRGKIEAFYIHYNDSGTDDGTAYLSDAIDYSQARFRPQLAKMHVFGLAVDYKIGKLSIKAEGDYLFGRDDINNATFNSSGIAGANDVTNADGLDDRHNTKQLAGNFDGRPGYLPPHFFNRLDKNNGHLRGWNAYLNMKYNDAFNAGKPGLMHFTPGLVAGAGSGDDDPTGGRGNINKIQTEGWFYVSEVWEDSIMPDLTGITPQGLGSPWSRGYREFENQILVQPNITWKFHPKWQLFLAYQHVWAMQDINAWASEDDLTGADAHSQFTDGDGNLLSEEDGGTRGGPDLNRHSRTIGDEVDWKLSYHVFSNLTLDLRGGIFFPGRGASYLIAGAQKWDAVAWEGRWDITFKF